MSRSSEEDNVDGTLGLGPEGRGARSSTPPPLEGPTARDATGSIEPPRPVPLPLPLPLAGKPPAPARRRFGSLAVAVLAAMAGVGAVLVVARVAMKPKPVADAPVATATAAGSSSDGTARAGSAEAPRPRVETIEPVPAPEPPPSPPAANAPAGVPLDPPRRPPAPPSIAAAPAPPNAAATPGAGNDLSTLVYDVQQLIRRRDAQGCRRRMTGLPPVHPSAQLSIETLASMCDMMAGDCAGGLARLERAHAAQGLVLQPASFTDSYCPVEGTLETRLSRLRAQVGAHANAAVMDLAWCDALIPHARKAGTEASTIPERTIAAFALQGLARCVAAAGRCEDARGLWSQSLTVDEYSRNRAVDLGQKCAAVAAELGAKELHADATAITKSLNTALQQRDPAACQRLVPAIPANLAPGARHGVEQLAARCLMLAGDCNGGIARLSAIEPNATGTVEPSIKAAWVRSSVEMYCPLPTTGTVDARLARLWAKVDAFSTLDGGGLVPWCDSLLTPARAIAGEVTTDKQRRLAGRALRQLASCVGAANRCDEGRALWALAVQTDPAIPAAPVLGRTCTPPATPPPVTP